MGSKGRFSHLLTSCDAGFLARARREGSFVCVCDDVTTVAVKMSKTVIFRLRRGDSFSSLITSNKGFT